MFQKATDNREGSGLRQPIDKYRKKVMLALFREAQAQTLRKYSFT